MRCPAGTAISAAVLLGTVAVPAAAEEMVYGAVLPAGPIYNPHGFYNWNGFYIGLNGGGHWGTDSVSASVAANTFLSPNNVAIINNALPFNKDVTGLAGGGQAGFNWHVWSFVLGVEADRRHRYPQRRGAADRADPAGDLDRHRQRSLD